MTVPGFQEMMLPLLRLAEDGQEHRIADAIEILATKLGIDGDQRAELLPSGKQSRFTNRVHWARTYLGKAILLERGSYGTFRITGRGLQVLSENPTAISMSYLERFPEYVEFRKKSRTADSGDEHDPSTAVAETPEEQLDAAARVLKQDLAQELLERVKRNSPEYFQQLVVDVLVAMGYGGSRPDAGKALGRGKDGGIDGLIKEDALGLDAIYIQAKRWEDTVGRPIVQAFVGALEGVRARKGVMITTSSFSPDATRYVETIDKRIVLIDGERLTELMIEHGVGVLERSLYRVMQLDTAYFDE